MQKHWFLKFFILSYIIPDKPALTLVVLALKSRTLTLSRAMYKPAQFLESYLIDVLA